MPSIRFYKSTFKSRMLFRWGILLKAVNKNKMCSYFLYFEPSGWTPVALVQHVYGILDLSGLMWRVCACDACPPPVSPSCTFLNLSLFCRIKALYFLTIAVSYITRIKAFFFNNIISKNNIYSKIWGKFRNYCKAIFAHNTFDAEISILDLLPYQRKVRMNICWFSAAMIDWRL